MGDLDGVFFTRTDEFLKLAEAGDLAGVSKMLSEGFPVDSPSRDGETALCRAADLGLVDMAQLLLDAKADPNCDAHWKPLARAAGPGFGDEDVMVALLLSAGADPEGRSGNHGVSALHAAHDAKTAELLIQAGSDIEARDARGETPIVAAVVAGRHDVAFALLDAGADAGRLALCDRPDALRVFAEAVASREAEELGVLVPEKTLVEAQAAPAARRRM